MEFCQKHSEKFNAILFQPVMDMDEVPVPCLEDYFRDLILQDF